MAKLIFTYGAMNAGKTTYLLQVAHNYESWGLKPLVFTYEGCDDKGSCRSRLGISRKSEIFNKEYSFLDVEVSNVAVILIDEAQFLTNKQVFDLCRIASLKGVPVMCYGLRTSWQAHVFEGSSALLGLADELREIRTICKCGKKATMARRIAPSAGTADEDIGQDKYVSVCRKCWFTYHDGEEQT
ncbi:MAG: thymidine kinase [Holosporales bacterium]|jgi:thymidine kinase|nr:thymidine kinase [Holosporales bacterium]